MNAAYFKNRLDLYHEFVPQTLMFVAMFGYMDFLIVVKWLTNYTGKTDQAPSIINTMVAMFLGGGEIKGQPFIPANTFVENILARKHSTSYLTIVFHFSDMFDQHPMDAPRKAMDTLAGECGENQGERQPRR